MHTNAFKCSITTVVANKNKNAQKTTTSVCLHSNPHPVRSVDILKNILSEAARVLFVGLPLWHVRNFTRFRHMGAYGIWFWWSSMSGKALEVLMFPDCSRRLIFKKITFKGLWCHHHVSLLPWLTVSRWCCYFINLYSKWTSSGTEQAGIYICGEVYNQGKNARVQFTWIYWMCFVVEEMGTTAQQRAILWQNWCKILKVKRNFGRFCQAVFKMVFFFLNKRKLLWAAKSMWSTVLLLWCHVVWKMAEMKAKMRVWNNYRNVKNCIVVLNG